MDAYGGPGARPWPKTGGRPMGQGPGPWPMGQGPGPRRQFCARAWLLGPHMYSFYVFICVHMYPYVSIYMYVYKSICVSICIHIYIYICISICVPCPVSRVPCPVSRVPCPVSRVRCPVSRVPCLVSRVPCPKQPQQIRFFAALRRRAKFRHGQSGMPY